MKRAVGPFLASILLCACSSPEGAQPRDAGPSDSTVKSDGAVRDAAMDAIPIDIDARPPAGAFCALPGSLVFTGNGPGPMPGGDPSAPSLGWLTLPQGFCAHYFGNVPKARQLRFAPDGRLFVSSPTQPTTGGALTGALAAILALDDTDQNGEADTTKQYLGGLPETQGLLFTGGYLYFQDGTTIRRVPFKNGDQTPSAPVEAVSVMTPQIAAQSLGHWTKVLDVAQDGTIYVTNGGDQGDTCLKSPPSARGAIFRLDPDGGMDLVSQGFRNPIALRCEADHDTCYVLELALDYSNDKQGREKIVPVQPGADWGYPCCATDNVAYTDVSYQDTGGSPDCSGVSQETVSFVIGETPFGLDFEPGKWPAPWTYRAFVAMHGVFGPWTDARIVSVARDTSTGAILPASDLDGGESANMQDFALGWDDGTKTHGRPGSVTFAPDGRMFVADDVLGVILWIAPNDLMP